MNTQKIEHSINFFLQLVIFTSSYFLGLIVGETIIDNFISIFISPTIYIRTFIYMTFVFLSHKLITYMFYMIFKLWGIK